MVIGGSHNPFTTLATIYESHSKITSRTPTSHAKRTPSSKAFSSISNGPSRYGIFLLSTASTLPAKSQITTPTPEEWMDLKVVPSTLSLYHETFGRDRGASSLDPPVLSLMLAIWNSSRRNQARCKISDPCCLVFPSRASFLLNHMHYATMTANSNSSLSVTPWPPTISVESTLQQNLFLQEKKRKKKKKTW